MNVHFKKAVIQLEILDLLVRLERLFMDSYMLKIIEMIKSSFGNENV